MRKADRCSANTPDEEVDFPVRHIDREKHARAARPSSQRNRWRQQSGKLRLTVSCDFILQGKLKSCTERLSCQWAIAFSCSDDDKNKKCSAAASAPKIDQAVLEVLKSTPLKKSEIRRLVQKANQERRDIIDKNMPDLKNNPRDNKVVYQKQGGRNRDRGRTSGSSRSRSGPR